MADLSNNPITQVTNDAYAPVRTTRLAEQPSSRLGRFVGKWFCCTQPVQEEAVQPEQAAPMTVYERPLLPLLADKNKNRKCLVLDLDETLVHSSFRPVKNADFIIPVEIDGHVHNVYVLKRPFVDEFMKRMGELYEVVIFTASLSKYADPVLDQLDIHKVIDYRLFRESCHFHKGSYVKDLGRLGRDLKDVLIIDNSPASYLFNPENALAISTWMDDPNDRELLDLVPFLEDLTKSPDVAETLAQLAASVPI